MKLTTLNALAAAIEEGSLRAAARRIHLSQPALSKMVRELEQKLGAPLLLRTARGVTPTAQGKVLYERSLKARRELDTALDEIRQIGGHMAGQLHIGAVPLAVMLLLPATLRSFVKECPDVRLRVSEELYAAQLQQLRTGEVDITIGGMPARLQSAEFLMEPLLQTTMVPVARKGSRWLQARSLAELQHAPWVYTGNQDETGYARLLFEQHRLEAPRKGAAVNSTLALLSLVSTGDFVALMPRQLASQALVAQFVARIDIAEDGLPLKLGAMLRAESAASPIIRALLKQLHRAAWQVTRGAGLEGFVSDAV